MQQGGGGGVSQSQYPQPVDIAPPTSAALTTHMLLGAGGGGDQHPHQHQLVVEEASPISSRPPATATTSSSAVAANLDEFMRLSGSGADEDALAAAGEEADRAGGASGGNRWPRQETLALLQIRSEMDAVFRDATLKGPLWEDVSRKLAELGYKRSAKKCKEKFENVHKYYKRTKEGRAGRQDGKSYRFFSQLEALHNTPSTASPAPASAPPSHSHPHPHPPPPTSLDVAPVSVGIPMPISSLRIPQPPSSAPIFPPDLPPVAPLTGTSLGISFSSDGTSSSPSSPEDDEDEDDDDELGVRLPSNPAAGASRKRKRQSSSSSSSSTRRMMEFFEGLMKQVMQKQETMQQRFLEAIEKREQDRMIREEAWKRQEMARLSREHELMAQERALSASRDAAIVAFLQKITGQTIQLPSSVAIPAVSQPPQPPPAQPQPQPQSVTIAPLVTVSVQPAPPPLQPQSQTEAQSQQERQQQERLQQQQHQQLKIHHHHQSSISSDIVMAVPEQQVAPQEMGSGESASSRWPKAEVLALIKLRSGLESRYQETGPKGPLWEEISAGMQQMGYKRSAKRCKEKWENINKYFKKVKESNKKRPEDAKTCPYFHELDALYRKKVLGSGSTTTTGGVGSSSAVGAFSNQNRQEEQQKQLENTRLLEPPQPTKAQEILQASQHLSQPSESQNKNGGGGAHVQASLFGEGNGGAAKKPEDIMKELMAQQGTRRQHQQEPLTVNDYDKMEEAENTLQEGDEDLEEEDGIDEDDDDEEEDEELEEERKMAYKIEFQRQNTSASNGGGNGAASFLAMVQ